MLDVSNVDFTDPEKVKKAFQDLINEASNRIDAANRRASHAERLAAINKKNIDETQAALEDFEQQLKKMGEE